MHLKSEALWDRHLSSPGHAHNLKARNDAPPTNKKRKVDTGEDDEAFDPLPKKAKSTGGVAAGVNGENEDGAERSINRDDHDQTNGRTEQIEDHQIAPVTAALPSRSATFSDSQIKPPTEPYPPVADSTEPVPKDSTVDEDEWAAFERDVATPPPETAGYNATVLAEATISAAPMTAAQLQAQSGEESSQQRRALKEAEIEGEQEDAARRLEEEFDEMEEYENRVKRLKEKRESLRRLAEQETSQSLDSHSATRDDDDTPGGHFESKNHEEEEEGEEEDTDDDSNDDWDGWRLR